MRGGAKVEHGRKDVSCVEFSIQQSNDEIYTFTTKDAVRTAASRRRADFPHRHRANAAKGAHRMQK